MRVLSKSFYERAPDIVARELLGKILVRKIDATRLSGKIVETEAYYGERDPASKAYRGRKVFNELMFLDVGRTFIYMVHGNWLLNIVAHPKGDVGAVLIRALEPINGLEVMQKNRKVKDLHCLTNGPGKLSRALVITKELNGVYVTKRNSPLMVIEGERQSFEVCSSHRIGVKFDLPQELRFFIKGNKFVSKASG
ncbi:MAG: DNA-3-methyladenine glycosylase [Candidatus Bathyarchaeota archaeon]|jgi:DNA-3-methyladenine glycosylase|nr:DNA-3-methyladenine glycosylase [Candidatus Bathyarchaeota archaeon]